MPLISWKFSWIIRDRRRRSRTPTRVTATILACALTYHDRETASALHRTMGKLNIAHHKSYHPYRRDNIERVRRDEEAERLKEEQEEGKMMVAVRCSSSL